MTMDELLMFENGGILPILSQKFNFNQGYYKNIKYINMNEILYEKKRYDSTLSCPVFNVWYRVMKPVHGPSETTPSHRHDFARISSYKFSYNVNLPL